MADPATQTANRIAYRGSATTNKPGPGSANASLSLTRRSR